jgi:AcrR family transcriptional regulator
VPSQERSRQRVERILDAAAHVFAEAGYDAATTEAIAEKAGTSIGSIYQFFPNKLALFNAIASRYLDRSRMMFEALMVPQSLERPWEELLDSAIDAFASFDRDEPDFRAVWVNWQLSGEFLAAGQALNREFARRTEAVLAVKAHGLSPQKRALVATVTVEMISAMLFLAARRRDLADKVIAETKVLLRRYLAGYADEAPAPPPRRKKSVHRTR